MSTEHLGAYQKPSAHAIRKFLIPSLFGLVIFLLPIPYQGEMNIPLGVISQWLTDAIKPFARELVTFFIVTSAVGSLICVVLPPSVKEAHPYLTANFEVDRYYLCVRVLGAIFVIMAYFSVGFPCVYESKTGQTMLNLLGTLIAWFFAASFLIPLLMNYGIMEFIGTFMRSFTKPLFRLPGRSTVDLLASWVGNCNVGVVLTTTQYEKGYYTARESITIATCFSAVSLPFCLVIAGMLGVAKDFFAFYLILAAVGVLSAMIMVRIPPLSLYPDTFYEKTGRQNWEQVPENLTRGQWALKRATDKAQETIGVMPVLKEGAAMFSGIIFALTSIVMCYGTLALILADYTPFFTYLSYPFAYYLQLLQVPDAFQAAPATIAGFADMIIPAVLGSNIPSYETRFIIGILSLVQIVYMTEVGTLIITSKMPIRLGGLILIFLEKTVIALPLIVLFTKLLGIG